MNPVIRILTVLLLLTSSLFSLEHSDSTGTVQNAFMFGLGDNFTLAKFDGSTISFKRLYPDDTERRFALTIGGDYSAPEYQEDRRNYYMIDDTTLFSGSDEQERDFGLQLTLGVYKIRHQKAQGPVRGYYGSGPYVSLISSRDHEHAEYQTGSVDNLTADRTAATLYLGIRGIFGVEWMAAPFLSVHAEYRPAARVGYTWSSAEVETLYSDKDERNISQKVKTPSLWAGYATLFGVSILF